VEASLADEKFEAAVNRLIPIASTNARRFRIPYSAFGLLVSTPFHLSDQGQRSPCIFHYKTYKEKLYA
jgi:hypothetical protein